MSYEVNVDFKNRRLPDDVDRLGYDGFGKARIINVNHGDALTGSVKVILTLDEDKKMITLYTNNLAGCEFKVVNKA